MENLTKKGFLCLFVFVLLSMSGFADDIIYDNSSLTGYSYPPDSNIELFDYGVSSGGRVSKITFRYRSSYTTRMIIRFYRSVDARYNDPGYLVKQLTINNLPVNNTWSVNDYTYEIPEADRFELPSGTFGYSLTNSRSDTSLYLASGGAGNQNELWEYDSYWDSWLSFTFTNSWAGLYFTVYTAPPINETTCDVSGFKFNDVNANGIWDNGEPAMTGWEFYIDENSDGSYQTSEPNVVTDPNGMYYFENLPAPATYQIREIMQSGWTQTLPGAGSNNQYTLAVEPNTLYTGYDFGNTEQVIPTEIKLYGYVKIEDGSPIEGVRVQNLLGSEFDDTDDQGYYEVVVSAPFTGGLTLTKAGWLQKTLSVGHKNLMSDYQQNFEMLHCYGGGDGTEAEPYLIYTAEQMNFIGRQPSHWDKHFVLMADIDLGIYTGMEYNIIGNDLDIYSYFTGTFNGNGHTISNFTYILPDGMIRDDIGLFGCMGGLFGSNAQITNLGIINPNIRGESKVGALMGNLERGIVSNCWVQGGNVSGSWDTGGLIGYVGGTVVKSCTNGGIVSCKYTGAGGLAGDNGGTIQNCYSSFEVEGIYSSTPVYEGVGGFVGDCMWGEITNCYSVGSVTRGGGGVLGGFCAYNYDCTFTNCFWDINTSNVTTSAGGAGVMGRNTAGMQTMQTYLDAGWDFTTTWRICDGMNYPRLQWEPFVTGDMTCPDGVELNDLMALADAWLTQDQAADIAPVDDPDGYVDLLDFAQLASHWMMGMD